MENWRFIEENPDYMISDHGRVLSFKGRSKLILCAKIMGTGYETVILPNKGVCIEYKFIVWLPKHSSPTRSSCHRLTTSMAIR